MSLVREHTAAINPPRALWVPFILGRPFGVPGDAAFQRRGRTTVGVSGVEVEQAARIVAAYLNAAPAPNFAGMSAGETLKVVCEDIRAYYFEAASARPGAPNASAIEYWFWHDTAAGRAFLALQKVCVASADESLRVFGGNLLVPRAIRHTLGAR